MPFYKLSTRFIPWSVFLGLLNCSQHIDSGPIGSPKTPSKTASERDSKSAADSLQSNEIDGGFITSNDKKVAEATQKPVEVENSKVPPIQMTKATMDAHLAATNDAVFLALFSNTASTADVVPVNHRMLAANPAFPLVPILDLGIRKDLTYTILPPGQLAAITGLQIKGGKEASAIVQSNDDIVLLKNFLLAGIDSSSQNIIFYFPFATSVTLSGSNIDGHVFAPMANVNIENTKVTGEIRALKSDLDSMAKSKVTKESPIDFSGTTGVSVVFDRAFSGPRPSKNLSPISCVSQISPATLMKDGDSTVRTGYFVMSSFLSQNKDSTIAPQLADLYTSELKKNGWEASNENSCKPAIVPDTCNAGKIISAAEKVDKSVFEDGCTERRKLYLEASAPICVSQNQSRSLLSGKVTMDWNPPATYPFPDCKISRTPIDFDFAYDVSTRYSDVNQVKLANGENYNLTITPSESTSYPTGFPIYVNGTRKYLSVNYKSDPQDKDFLILNFVNTLPEYFQIKGAKSIRFVADFGPENITLPKFCLIDNRKLSDGSNYRIHGLNTQQCLTLRDICGLPRINIVPEPYSLATPCSLSY